MQRLLSFIKKHYSKTEIVFNCQPSESKEQSMAANPGVGTNKLLAFEF
jgi:hypothetical protein